MQLVELLSLALESVYHLLALCVVELEPRHLLGALDARGGDVFTRCHLRPQHAGEEGRTQPDAAEVAHERATIVGAHVDDRIWRVGIRPSI